VATSQVQSRCVGDDDLELAVVPPPPGASLLLGYQGGSWTRNVSAGDGHGDGGEVLKRRSRCDDGDGGEVSTRRS